MLNSCHPSEKAASHRHLGGQRPGFACSAVVLNVVVESLHPGVAVGERLYGYWPKASHMVLQPTRRSAHAFSDGGPHRAAQPARLPEIEMVGLTSAGNVAYGESLGVYSRVLTDDQLDTLPAGATSARPGADTVLRAGAGHEAQRRVGPGRVQPRLVAA